MCLARHARVAYRCSYTPEKALTWHAVVNSPAVSPLRYYSSDEGNHVSGPGLTDTPFPDLSKLLSRTHTPSTQPPPSSGNFFDGNFVSGSPFIEANMLTDMHRKLRESLTPEVRESMAAMMQSAVHLGGAQGTSVGMPDCGGGAMGMMAFGIAENEKGKKVARAAKLSYDLKTGKVSKDFAEMQIEPDDISLPRDTVEAYNMEDATEVQFVKDGDGTTNTLDVTVEPISETEVTIESTEMNK